MALFTYKLLEIMKEKMSDVIVKEVHISIKTNDCTYSFTKEYEDGRLQYSRVEEDEILE